MTIELHRATDPDDLARQAAAAIAAEAWNAFEARGRFAMAVSGGSTPARLFAALAEMTIPWGEVHVLQVDERIAPTGHPDRNLVDLTAQLLGRVIIPWRNVHPMPVGAQDPDTAADWYSAELQEVCGGVLDLVHLGLGDDGHTASWPPDHPEIDAWTGDVGVTTPFNGRARLTLTPAAVNRARAVLWVVSGAAKAPLVTRLRHGDPTIPASRVTVERQVLYGDDAALD